MLQSGWSNAFPREQPRILRSDRKSSERASPVIAMETTPQASKRTKYSLFLSGSYQQRMFLTSRREGCTPKGGRGWVGKCNVFVFGRTEEASFALPGFKEKWLLVLCMSVCLCAWSVQVGPVWCGVVKKFEHFCAPFITKRRTRQSSCWCVTLVPRYDAGKIWGWKWNLCAAIRKICCTREGAWYRCLNC